MAEVKYTIDLDRFTVGDYPRLMDWPKLTADQRIDILQEAIVEKVTIRDLPLPHYYALSNAFWEALGRARDPDDDAGKN